MATTIKHGLASKTKSKKTLASSTSSLQEEWDKQLQTPHSKELLKSMAQEALKEHSAGKTERGGFGR